MPMTQAERESMESSRKWRWTIVIIGSGALALNDLKRRIETAADGDQKNMMMAAAVFVAMLVWGIVANVIWGSKGNTQEAANNTSTNQTAAGDDDSTGKTATRRRAKRAE